MELLFIGFVLFAAVGIIALFVRFLTWSIKRSRTRTCPECRARIDKSAKRCRHCGQPVSGDEPATLAAPKQSDQERHREMLAKFRDQQRRS